MARQRTFLRDEVFPSYIVNVLEDFISALGAGITVEQADDTTVRVPAGPGDERGGIAIDEQWRWADADVTRAHPGGAAGTYDVWVTATENVVVNVPDANTDETDYSFDLAITAHGVEPAAVVGSVEIWRQVATLEWDGVKITRVDPLVGKGALPAVLREALVPTGVLLPTGADTADPGFIMANGQTEARAAYPALFDKYGTKFNIGGEAGTDFRMPKVKGRALVGLGTHADVNAVGKADAQVDANRTPKHVILPGEMPAHSHGVSDPGHGHGVSDPGHGHFEQAEASATNAGGFFLGGFYGNNSAGLQILGGTAAALTGIGIIGNGTGISLLNAGGGGAHDHGFLVVNFMAKT